MGVDLERTPEQRGGLAVLAERHVAQPLAGQRAEMVRVAAERLLTIRDRAGEILGHVADRGPLVPALGELRRPLDDPGEHAPRRIQVLALHGLDSLPEEPVHLRDSRVAPDLPERGFRPGHEPRVAAPEGGERLGLGHRDGSRLMGPERNRPPGPLASAKPSRYVVQYSCIYMVIACPVRVAVGRMGPWRDRPCHRLPASAIPSAWPPASSRS